MQKSHTVTTRQEMCGILETRNSYSQPEHPDLLRKVLIVREKNHKSYLLRNKVIHKEMFWGKMCLEILVL